MQDKFINQISSSLRNFKQLSSNLYNFSCPYCGDSHTNARKARGYLYFKSNEYFYRCHNCDIGKKFSTFLSDNYPTVYNEWLIDNLKNKKINYYSTKVYESSIPNIFEKLKTINQSKHTKSYEYLVNRKIPASRFDELYCVSNFLEFYDKIVKPLLEDKFEHRITDTDEKVIIPFLNYDKSVTGFQARRIDSSPYQRYINIILDKNHSKIYGLHRLNINKQIYVVEGAFDSMFIDNCIAMSGTNIKLPYFIKNEIYIFDNENRNSYTVSSIYKKIKEGKKVVIFPKYIHQKDLNEMINDCIDVVELINNNTYYSIMAELKFNEWSKV